MVSTSAEISDEKKSEKLKSREIFKLARDNSRARNICDFMAQFTATQLNLVWLLLRPTKVPQLSPQS